MSIEILKNEFFKTHALPDMNVNPNYGVVKLQTNRADLVTARIEISSGVGEEETANVNNMVSGIRKVSMWRIPSTSKIAGLFHKFTIDVNKIFNYKISAIQDIQYLEYTQGDYYKPHSDINCEIGSTRKISFSWVIDDDFEGGDLKINYGGEEQTLDTTNNPVWAFTSFMTHEVTPITRGKRKVLVCWVSGESWR